MSTQVIFIDGPHAVGKDYFIENLIKQLKEEQPEKKVEVLRATDFLTPLIKTNRFYEHDNKLSTENHAIFHGHLRLMNRIKELIDYKLADLVIVNRSFASFLIYNLNTDFNNNTPQLNTILSEDKRQFIDSYTRTFKNMFRYISTLFINLTIDGGTIDEKVDNIVARIKSRSENKEVNVGYLTYLTKSYSGLDNIFTDMFNEHQELKSGSFHYVIAKYLT